MGALKYFLSRCKHLGARERGFAADKCGSVLVEAAFVIPILLVTVMGGIEVSRFILLDHKVARVAFNVADLTARADAPTAADIDQVFLAVEYIAEPFELDGDDTVIISSVSRAVGSASTLVNWQEHGGGGGSATSRIGAAGETASLPAVVNLREGQALIVGEAFYEYRPFFFEGFVEPRTVYQAAFYRPRDIVLALEGSDDGGGGGGGGGGDDDDDDDDDVDDDDDDDD